MNRDELVEIEAAKALPAEIEATANELIAVERALTGVKLQLQNLEIQADQRVGANSTLKNDTMRKVARHELLQSMQAYHVLSEKAERMVEAKEEAKAKLERLRGEFAVAKLLLQHLTALTMVDRESVELKS